MNLKVLDSIYTKWYAVKVENFIESTNYFRYGAYLHVIQWSQNFWHALLYLEDIFGLVLFKM